MHQPHTANTMAVVDGQSLLKFPIHQYFLHQVYFGYQFIKVLSFMARLQEYVQDEAAKIPRQRMRVHDELFKVQYLFGI